MVHVRIINIFRPSPNTSMDALTSHMMEYSLLVKAGTGQGRTQGSRWFLPMDGRYGSAHSVA
jgi:hypothetical protein